VEQARAEAEARVSQERRGRARRDFRALFEAGADGDPHLRPGGPDAHGQPALTQTFGLQAEALRDYNIFDDHR
jgi:hypothetical protein